jgi:hypothetical protein
LIARDSVCAGAGALLGFDDRGKVRLSMKR